jgi:hypothetical protein
VSIKRSIRFTRHGIASNHTMVITEPSDPGSHAKVFEKFIFDHSILHKKDGPFGALNLIN